MALGVVHSTSNRYFALVGCYSASQAVRRPPHTECGLCNDRPWPELDVALRSFRVTCSRDWLASRLLQVKCHYDCPLQSNHTRPHRNSSYLPHRTTSSGCYQSETFGSSPLELVASWKSVLPSVFQVPTNSSGQSSAPGLVVSSSVTPETVAATPTITTMTKSSKPSVGNFRSISCSFTSLTRTPPHKTLPKRRVRSGQVGNPDARRTKLFL